VTVYYGPGQERERERAVHGRNSLSGLAAALNRYGTVACVRPNDLDHRATDARLPADPEQRLPAGQWTCQTCHETPTELETERRVDVEPGLFA
jgi:hypothetical protein